MKGIVWSLVGLVSLASPVSAVVTLTGLPDPDWTSAGNSLDAGRWARGSTDERFSFDASWRSFRLSSSDEFAAFDPGSVSGDAPGTLTSLRSSWQVNDRILGLSVLLNGFDTYATNGFYYKVDPAGTGTWTAASSVGAADGNASFSGGGTQGGFSGWQHPHGFSSLPPGYFGRAERYTDASGTVFANGAPGAKDFQSAVLGWSLINPGLGSGNRVAGFAGMILFNFDEMVRIGLPVAPISSGMKLVFGAYGQQIDLDGNVLASGLGQDMAYTFAGDPFISSEPVPEPGTLALGALGLAAAVRRRRRRAG